MQSIYEFLLKHNTKKAEYLNNIKDKYVICGWHRNENKIVDTVYIINTGNSLSTMGLKRSSDDGVNFKTTEKWLYNMNVLAKYLKKNASEILHDYQVIAFTHEKLKSKLDKDGGDLEIKVIDIR